jgi:dihydrofolate synthase/folylpolyglutamate synthase
MENIEIAYQEALDYLYSFIDYSLTRAFRYSPEKFDLSRMRSLAERLGNPQEKYKSIHVAGTKGKGSTSALIAKSLQEAGYKVGFYTSPHLTDYTERIKVDDEPIPHADFVELVNVLKEQVQFVPEITTFELTTALAFLYFQKCNVDIAVLEVGLGGRLDATNIVVPEVSVITSISYDHEHVLGDTLAKIAYEKAGIIKKGRPIVLSPQKEEARKVVVSIAEARNAKLFQVGQDFLFAPWSHSLSGQSLLVWSKAEQPQVNAFIESGGRQNWEPLRLTIPLLGYHQVENAATAYAALQVARDEGIAIQEGDIVRGFANVFWPGRFEVLRRNPPLIIDSAHNPDSALKLRLAIDDYLPGQPVILLFGASEDKDIHGMFSALLPRVKTVIATQSVHPRAIEPEKLVEQSFQFGCSAQAVVPIEAALNRALELAGQETVIVASGSLFIAAAVREIWFNMKRDMHPATLTNGKIHV